MPIEESVPARLRASQIPDVYARLAPLYGFWERIAERQATKLALDWAEVRPGEKVLEVAVGPGNALEQLARTHRGGRLVAADLTPVMLQRAAQRFERQGRTGLLLCQCDACLLPFADRSFDLVFCAYLLDLFCLEDIEKALDEMRRVLRPTGRLVLLHLSMGHPWFDRVWRIFYWLVPTMLGGCRPIRVAPHLPELGWKVLQSREVLQWGIPSEVVLARRAD